MKESIMPNEQIIKLSHARSLMASSREVYNDTVYKNTRYLDLDLNDTIRSIIERAKYDETFVIVGNEGVSAEEISQFKKLLQNEIDKSENKHLNLSIQGDALIEVAEKTQSSIRSQDAIVERATTALNKIDKFRSFFGAKPKSASSVKDKIEKIKSLYQDFSYIQNSSGLITGVALTGLCLSPLILLASPPLSLIILGTLGAVAVVGALTLTGATIVEHATGLSAVRNDVYRISETFIESTEQVGSKVVPTTAPMIEGAENTVTVSPAPKPAESPTVIPTPLPKPGSSS